MGELKKLGKYEIISILGQGAMGIVYKGFDPHIERTVAIKTIRKDALDHKEMEPLLVRFKREAQAAGRLTHPGIVTVYEYGEEDDSAYIAMEFVQGRELKSFLDNNERFPLEMIISIISQLLDALAYSHDNGVVHRDIKPGNIIIPENGKIKVTDFGIARIESSTLTQFGDVIGTPSYMSPEQFGGQQVDKRSDLFSTGVILYHLLTGEKPFPGNSMTTIMHRVLNTDPPLASDLNFQVPSAFDSLIFKALAKKTHERFQSAEEFASELELTYQSSKADCVPLGTAAGNDTVMINAADEATIDLPAGEIPQPAPPPKPGGGDLQHKFDKIVKLLESKGIADQEAEHNLYQRARRLVLVSLICGMIAFCSYLVWKIYSDNLTYHDLSRITNEKTADIREFFTGKRKPVREVSKQAKKKPASEFQKEAALIRDLEKNSKDGELEKKATPLPIVKGNSPTTQPASPPGDKSNFL
ncbi:MAG: serine/threonine-protein kinase [Thermodesulfobacteriota bacterium]